MCVMKHEMHCPLDGCESFGTYYELFISFDVHILEASKGFVVDMFHCQDETI